MTINERIKIVIDHYKMNQNSFSKAIGLNNNTTIGNIVSTRMNAPSFDVLLRIMQTFVDISADWLITGNGEMLKRIGKDPPGACSLCETYKEIINDLRLINRQLSRRIIELEKQIEDCKPVQKRKAG